MQLLSRQSMNALRYHVLNPSMVTYSFPTADGWSGPQRTRSSKRGMRFQVDRLPMSLVALIISPQTLRLISTSSIGLFSPQEPLLSILNHGLSYLLQDRQLTIDSPAETCSPGSRLCGTYLRCQTDCCPCHSGCFPLPVSRRQDC